MGFQVDCLCYSEYLSDRDFQEFKHIFESLEISKFIFYGTFNKAFEKYINRQGDIRDLTIEILSNRAPQIKNVDSNIPKIMLVDEVDVFFSSDYFGKLYNPIAKLRHPSITNLIKSIWNLYEKKGKEGLSFEKILASPEFTECKNNFPEIKQILVEALKSILTDVKESDQHAYIFEDGKVGYKDQDAVNYNMTYGYNTLFAYFKEKIAKDLLDEKICIQINTGQFSYAEMPTKFKLIIGSKI